MNKLCLLLFFCVVLFQANSQPGSPDPSFGKNGIQTTSFFNNINSLDEEGADVLISANGNLFAVVRVNDYATIIARYLPDGTLDSSYGNAGYSSVAALRAASAAMQGNKIIVAGSAAGATSVYFNSYFAFARYTADGTLDSSFGENGIVKTDFGSSGYSEDYATSIMLQGDKIVVAGSAALNLNSYDFALARYTPDGTLDSSFGVNGKVISDFNDGAINAIALQGDKIIAGGSTYNPANGTNDFALVRYTANGTLDSSFGENGKTTTDFNSSDDYATSIVLQGDKIIMAGSTNYVDFALARYTTDGILDASFGVNGIVITDFNSSDDYATSIALQVDKIIVGGGTGDYSNGDFALARYTPDGTLDATFGMNGLVTTDINNSNDAITSIVLQGDKIVVAGNANYVDFALARYTANGVLNPSFGKNGLLTGYFPTSHAFFTSVAMQGNKIIAAGYTTNDSSNTDFALARYSADGTLDLTFGKNGKITTDINNSNDYAYSMVLQGDKIIVGGSTYNAVDGNNDFAITRYTKDGVLDSSFGVNGIVGTDFNYDDRATSIALQGNRIVVAGSDYDPVSEKVAIALARYTADGTLDSSFGVNGKTTTHFNDDGDFFAYNHAYSYSIALQGNKIVVGGYTPVFEGQDEDFALARYTANGVLDSSFGVNGKVTTDFNGAFDNATSIVLQGDKIVVAGATGDVDFGSDFALARYTADGRLDSSFGRNGKVTTDFSSGSSDRATSIALQGDKIILAGYAGAYNGDWISDFALARYTANGALDSTFGVYGKVTTDLGEGDILQAIIVHQNKLYAVGGALYAVGGVGSLNYPRGIPYPARGTTYGTVAAYQLEPSAPAISIADVTVSESKRLAVATVRLSAPANKLVRVHFTTKNKTAVHNQDYISVSGPLLFIPGVNTTAKIIIPIVDDNASEDAEQFKIILTNAHNAIIQDSIAVVTIIDDDNALIAKLQSTSLQIKANPNPSADVFTIQLQSSDYKQPANIRVYDINGRLLEQITNIAIGQNLRLGDQYTAGTYIIEAVQGSRSIQTKVIKIGK